MGLATRIELGDKVKDNITGLKGIVTTISEHLYGCRHVWVQPEDMKDGKPLDPQCFDEARVELIKRAAVTPPPAAVAKNPGGPSRMALPKPRLMTGR